MLRRTFLQWGIGAALARPLRAAIAQERFEAAAGVLSKAAADGRVHAASLCVRHGKTEFARPFGAAKTPEAMFVLASITKTLTAAAVMTLVDQEKLRGLAAVMARGQYSADLRDVAKKVLRELLSDVLA